MSYQDMELKEFLAKIVQASGAQQSPVNLALKQLPKKLEAFSISTVGEFWGSLHPDLPPVKRADDAARRGINKAYLATSSTGKSVQQLLKRRVSQLAKAVDCPVSVIERLCNEIKKMPPMYLDSRPAQAEWFLGQQTAPDKVALPALRELQVRKLPAFKYIKPTRQPMILPELSKRIGVAWDQGRRGSCVAQAAGGLIGYLAGGFDPSTQFLYHQCKLIDGISDQEGTYIEVALRVLSDSQLSGIERFWNATDMGVPSSSAWPYVTTFQPGNPAQTPPPQECKQLLYSSVRAFNAESKTGSAAVLRCSKAKQEIVDDIRFLLAHLKVPVIAGFPLYESFNNQNSRRTGKITLPLPGESLVGGHAMLIVGFDDAKKCFVVRNSWGPEWGWDCKYEDELPLAGHAIIPYAYFERADIRSIAAYALQQGAVARFTVPEQMRLYRNVARSRLAKKLPLDAGRLATNSMPTLKPSAKPTPKPSAKSVAKSTITAGSKARVAKSFFDFLKLR